jgi:hypothetical protein
VDDGWLARQQVLLKQSRGDEVLAELELLRLATEQDEGPICEAIGIWAIAATSSNTSRPSKPTFRSARA